MYLHLLQLIHHLGVYFHTMVWLDIWDFFSILQCISSPSKGFPNHFPCFIVICGQRFSLRLAGVPNTHIWWILFSIEYLVGFEYVTTVKSWSKKGWKLLSLDSRGRMHSPYNLFQYFWVLFKHLFEDIISIIWKNGSPKPKTQEVQNGDLIKRSQSILFLKVRSKFSMGSLYSNNQFKASNTTNEELITSLWHDLFLHNNN